MLPSDNSRIADESSLLIMDILVELEDGSLANVECQKIGYMFPGQRCACYSADLLLRQYKQIRNIKGDMFSYKDVKKVYTIVIFETSAGDFHAFPKDYIHYATHKTNTGLQIDFLQEYILIPLDIFRQNLYNRGIENQLDAWLAFLSVDDPEWIVKLIQSYPEFKPLYNEVYAICRNTERIMGIYSEELKILDRNTVRLMIDQMQDKIDTQQKLLLKKDDVLAQKDIALAQKDDALAQKDEVLAQKDDALARKDEEIARLMKLLEQKDEARQ